MESDSSDFETETPTNFAAPRPEQDGSRVKVRGKGKDWRKIKTCLSDGELQEWLDKDTGQWVKIKLHKTAEGVKQYLTCRYPGCRAELVTWYLSRSIEVNILLHGDHVHDKGETDCKPRGLTAATKKVRLPERFYFVFQCLNLRTAGGGGSMVAPCRQRIQRQFKKRTMIQSLHESIYYDSLGNVNDSIVIQSHNLKMCESFHSNSWA